MFLGLINRGDPCASNATNQSQKYFLSSEIEQFEVDKNYFFNEIEHFSNSFRVLKNSLCNLQRKIFKTLKEFEKCSILLKK